MLAHIEIQSWEEKRTWLIGNDEYILSPSSHPFVHGAMPPSPSAGGSSRTASIVPIRPCDHTIGFGSPVEPEVCRRQNGSLMASSHVLVYG